MYNNLCNGLSTRIIDGSIRRWRVPRYTITDYLLCRILHTISKRVRMDFYVLISDPTDDDRQIAIILNVNIHQWNCIAKTSMYHLHCMGLCSLYNNPNSFKMIEIPGFQSAKDRLHFSGPRKSNRLNSISSSTYDKETIRCGHSRSQNSRQREQKLRDIKVRIGHVTCYSFIPSCLFTKM